MRVSESVVVVTGGASGIGEGVAAAVTASGGQVAIFDIHTSSGAIVADGLGTGALFVPVDVTVPDEVARAVATVVERFGRIDVLVNCAGISPAARIVGRDGALFPLEKFRAAVEVNLIGSFDVLRNCAGAMAQNTPSDEGERGLVINIGSIAAFEGQVGQSAYTASKGGLVAMTLPLARDLATQGIRAMTICPGTVDTPMVQQSSEEIRTYLRDANVFPKRLGRAEDIADLVRTCMETTYLNGEVIRVDAGVRMAPR